MESYLMMLYVTLDQESALKSFFVDQGWAFCKPDLSVTTDRLGSSTGPLRANRSSTRTSSRLVRKRKSETDQPRAPVVKTAKVLHTVPSMSANIAETDCVQTEQLDVTTETELLDICGSVNDGSSVSENQGETVVKIESFDVSNNPDECDEEYDDDTDIDYEEAKTGDEEEPLTVTEDNSLNALHGDIATDVPKDTKDNHSQMRRKNRQYSPSALTHAYKMVKDGGVSVRKAAAIHRVPQSTLRDRTLGLVDTDTVSAGTPPLFDQFEEVTLVNHFKKMADFGYGYTRKECVDMASDYAIQLGKRSKDKPLSMKWMRGFLKRWPELRVVKSQRLEYAQMASKEVVSEYFTNLKSALLKHNLIDKPHLIFNVDEKGITVEHKTPFVVAGSSQYISAVTSGKGHTITILGCGSAAGQAIPPYFVFPGKRMRKDLLHGASPETDGTVSETGWSNGTIFRKYIESHFMKFVPVRSGEKMLLILDGHMSHVSVGLFEWALQLGIIIFVLPPHCNHILQPMDIGCFGPFQQLYDAQCHKLMSQTSAVITRYNICETACHVYTKALSPENVQSAFRRSGIYPFNVDAVPKEKLLPAEVFHTDTNEETDCQATVEGRIAVYDQSAVGDSIAVDYLLGVGENVLVTDMF